MTHSKYNRRNFIRTGATAGLGLTLLPYAWATPQQKEKIKIGFIGVGLRGQNHLELALKRTDVEVVAICDIQQVMLDTSIDMFKKANKTLPKQFKDNPYAYRDLLKIKEIDAVIISTPWEWHYTMCMEAMQAGKYVGCEVITGITINEMHELVKTSEVTGKPLMMLENVCYRRDVLAVLQMVRKNMFGEIIHLQGGYQHDLREVKFNDGKQPYGGGVQFGATGFSEAQWRTAHSVLRNGDLYPTHGIGPLAMMININRGNRFVSLTSFASKARGLHNYIVDKAGEQHPNAKVNFKLGDVVTTMIKCANEETILLTHDTSLPRPYSLGFRVQGAKGIWMDLNNSIYLEGTSPQAHRWEPAKPYLENNDHPLWKKYGADATGAGHGGMDFFVLHAFVESVKRQTQTPLDVYDAVTWSAITPLSEKSIAMGGQLVDFPDFTNGQWVNRKNKFALDDSY
ncbi:MAG: Gfo/Idh/MocA family oxidoreductase [Bacteroidia bacterium]|nr:Gfo/Idh/MocA family oxidoreductase [Bacteroidia bacterium]HQU99755.1 Gfo/Idh/MocA family oxidoreductase [Bacteroidia bacterium]